MRQFQTSILERKTPVSDGFTSEPFETGWASEAIFFINLVEQPAGAPGLEVFAQLSPDGVRWVDEGSRLGTLDTTGLYFLRLRRFGGWLRLRFACSQPEAEHILILHLALKE